MRLSRADTDRLVRDVLRSAPRPESSRSVQPAASTLESVHRLSQGNPLFATEIARTITASSTGDGPAIAALPDSVRELVGARLARMDDPTRSLMAALAVAGAAVSLREIEDVVRGTFPPPNHERDLTDRLVAARMIDECQVVHAGRPAPGVGCATR